MIASSAILEIKNLHATIHGRKILNGINLSIKAGEIHYIMGKNAAGKSSLAEVIMGHSDYKVIKGKIFYGSKNITKLEIDKRARLGIYLAYQYPIEIPGVNLFNFLRVAYNSKYPKEKQLSVFKFRKYLYSVLETLNIQKEFLDRNLNEGFSGGEKKKCEILQMIVLNPSFVILDEVDSGLDIDAVKEVFRVIAKIKREKPSLSFLIITHYNRILKYLPADRVHVLENGKIIKSGGAEMIKIIGEKGYTGLT